MEGCPCKQQPWSQLRASRERQAIVVTAKLPDADAPEELEVRICS